MTHVVEMVTALLGACLVIGGSICTFRLESGKECPPAVERFSMAMVMVGALAVAAALALFAVTT